jgi:flavin-dependent dehydrogenase
LCDDHDGRRIVRGVVVARRDGSAESRLPAFVTIGADGCRSALARALGLIRYPASPRRWAFGVYARDVEGMSDVGEMHVRPGSYLGVAPVGGGLSNVCVVTGPRPEGPAAVDVVWRAIRRDPRLDRRFARASIVGRVRVLGPLAADVATPGAPGLLLAGDAAGFVDPMTGDGLHFALRGGLLAARHALAALETTDLDAAVRHLAADRHRAFRPKLRFNRLIRRIVASPAAIETLTLSARIAPGWVSRAVRYAGDSAVRA